MKKKILFFVVSISFYSTGHARITTTFLDASSAVGQTMKTQVFPAAKQATLYAYNKLAYAGQLVSKKWKDFNRIKPHDKKKQLVIQKKPKTGAPRRS